MITFAEVMITFAEVMITFASGVAEQYNVVDVYIYEISIWAILRKIK